MRFSLIALLLLGCGDNIVPTVPDAPEIVIPDEMGDPGGVQRADAGVPDAALPVCDDKHIELNEHEHKCQHLQRAD